MASENWILLVVCVFYCLIPGFFSEDNDCQDVPLKTCDLEINAELIPSDRKEWPGICKKLLQYRICILEHFTAKDLCGWPLVLQKSDDLIDELCYEDTLLSEKFLEFIPCIKSIVVNYIDECEVWAEAVNNVITEYETLQNMFSPDCMKREVGTTSCYRLYILRRCGRTAEYVYNKILQRSYYFMLRCIPSEVLQAYQRELQQQIDITV